MLHTLAKNNSHYISRGVLMIQPILTDVSLRDGLQSSDLAEYPTIVKKQMFDKIVNEHKPAFIEIGSIVNPKFFPIMADSIELHNELSKTYNNLHILVPALSKLQVALDNNMQNLSFITSVSDDFQKRNTNKSLDHNKIELVDICKILDNYQSITKKLYISCINYCPVKKDYLPNQHIVNEIKFYNDNCNFNELCLSDTAGKLSFDNYREIITGCELLGIPMDILSLHLHVNKLNTDDVKHILKFSFYKKINKFDVSMLETGGCTMALAESDRLGNLSYELFNETLNEYAYDIW